jgi:hypothetical protein
MAAKKPSAADLSAAKPVVSSLVKKDLKQIKDYAASVSKALKQPGMAAMRICECCIQVS